MNFKVGDKVRLVGRVFSLDCIGKIGTISQISNFVLLIKCFSKNEIRKQVCGMCIADTQLILVSSAKKQLEIE